MSIQNWVLAWSYGIDWQLPGCTLKQARIHSFAIARKKRWYY